MKQKLLFFFAAMVCSMTMTATDGARGGGFTINKYGDKVQFARGNLQFNAMQGTHLRADGTTAKGTWRFAEEQYDYIGEGNQNISETYDGWIDNFGWATSGWDNTANDPYAINFQPWSSTRIYDPDNKFNTYGYGWSGSKSDSKYFHYDETGYSWFDWGVYNAISNGGNQPNLWRSLTQEEWWYIRVGRENAEKLRGLATIEGVRGLMLFPDDVVPDGTFRTYIKLWDSGNQFSLEEWRQLERKGVVFLPASGLEGTSNINSVGYYWLQDRFDNEKAYAAIFLLAGIDAETDVRAYRKSVRLVQPYEAPVLVEAPAEAETKAGTLEGDCTSTGSIVVSIQYAFVGTDVYVQGLSNYFPEAWLKGTLNTETGLVSFPSGQFVGKNYLGNLYVHGSEDMTTPCDIVFKYDAETGTLTQQTSCIVESFYKERLDCYSYWENIVYYLGELVDYTVKYVDAEGNELKQAVARKGIASKKVTLAESDKESIYSKDGTKKYIYDSDNADTVVLSENAEGNVVTVVFREAETFYATVNCMANGTYERLAQYNETFFEDEDYAIYPPVGLRGSDGKYYFTTPTKNNIKISPFPANITPVVRGGKTYYSFIVLYNEDASVAYYQEMENLGIAKDDDRFGIVGLGQFETLADGNMTSPIDINREYFSQGIGIDLYPESYVWTEPIAEAGTYSVSIYGRNADDRNTYPFSLGYRTENGDIYLYDELSAPAWPYAEEASTHVIDGVAIPAGASLVLMNELSEEEYDGYNIQLDNIKLVRTGDYVELPVGIETLSDSPLKGENIYNLAGQRMSKMQKGVNIVNGKKVLVK